VVGAAAVVVGTKVSVIGSARAEGTTAL